MKTTTEKQLVAIKQLGTFDHAYLQPGYAREVAREFGIENLRMQKQRNNPDAFKGLSVAGAKKGAVIEGYDARDLADYIASHIGVEVPTMFGRGSGLRAAVQAIVTYLESLTT